ncbi:MAG: ArsR/SmtB family transcription factor [Parvularculaceae bacterium]
MLQYQADLDRKFHALADPTRRALLERLGEGPAAVSDLAAPMDMTLTAVMQHLGVLEDSGLVRTRKTGRRRMCEIDAFGVTVVEEWIAHRKAQWERRFDRLGAVVSEAKSAREKRK